MFVVTITVGQLSTNCYIVHDGKSGVIIDPGDDGEKIAEKLFELGIKLEYIILTHTHFDHMGAVDYIKENTGAKVAFGTFDTEGYYTQLPMFSFAKLPRSKPDILLSDGDIIKFGTLSLKVIHTPGHTKGGISLIGENCIFCGDTLFFESIGRTDFPGGNYETEIASAQRILNYPDDTVLYCGHGPSTTVIHEKTCNFYIAR